MINVVVSGGFDPVHIGHLRLLNEARSLGDSLTVILNSDKFLIKKKGFIFMPFKERKEILLGFSSVNKVMRSIDSDQTVSKTINLLAKKKKIDIFANGGDRKKSKDLPEYQICKRKNVKLVFNVGGGKIQSSSNLTKHLNNYKEARPWGTFENLSDEKNFKIKKIIVNPGQKLSKQFHAFRDENWLILKGKGKFTIGNKKIIGKPGDNFYVHKKQIHRIENIGKSKLTIIEIQHGKKLSESDIIRLDDVYGRI